MATLKVTNIKNDGFAGDQLYLKSDGKIGIGTASPNHLLHVEGALSGTTGFNLTNTHASGYGLYVKGGGTGNYAFRVDNQAGTEALRIVDGKLGIATTSPTAQLDVRRTDADGKIAEFHQNSGYGVDIGSSQADAYISSGYNQKFNFKTDAAGGAGQETRLVIDQNGRIWIGGTAVPSGDTRYLNIISTALTEASISFSRSNSLGGNTCGQTIRLDTTGNLIFAVHNVGTKFTLKSDGNVEIVDNLKTNNLPGNNLIHNGEFAIWQRGTTSIYSSQNKYLADRFKFVSNSDGNGSVHQHTNVPTVAQTGGSKFAYSLRLNCTTADASLANNQYINLSTRIEGQDLRYLGFGETGTRYATLSFWQRSPSGTYHVSFRNSAYNRYYIASYTAANNTWEKHELTIPVDTTGTWTTDTTAGVDITWSLGGGSWYNQGTVGSWQAGSSHAGNSQKNFFDTVGNDFYITGVQFEKGAIATPFEHKSYGEDLRLCQRYYQRWKRGYLCGNSVGTSDINIGIPLLVPLRAVPTIPALDMHRSGNKTVTVTIVSYEYSDVNSMILELRVGNWTGGNAVVDEVAYVLIPSGDTMELIADI